MRVSAVLTQTQELWLAQCEEIDRSGEGRTPDEALASLRQALEEYFDVEAVAPPPDSPTPRIDIFVVDGPTR
jgi:predicted RNase H-like HicB family nuclease